MNSIDWFNFNGVFADIFKGIRDVNLITPTEAALFNPEEPNANDLNTPTFICNGTTVKVIKKNPYGFTGTISKFMLLSAARFKFNDRHAEGWIREELMNEPNPYIRVGTDYYKLTHKKDRYGTLQSELKPWKKLTIQDDRGRSYLAEVPTYDDFVIEPDNLTHRQVIGDCYNLYSPFAHTPHEGDVGVADIPVTFQFLNHIFAGADRDHFNIGLTYLKCMYEYPRQILPVLVLLSKDRDTGKTTFNNWLTMIFGANFVSISPDALTRQFNANYAYKNIITFEEAFIDKQQGIERLKHLSTCKMIDVSQKFVTDYSIPFFGKFILYTNKVLDFMRIDSEEIRFWVRPIPKIKGKKNVRIEDELLKEIPKFLKYLLQLPPIDFDTGSRMLLTSEQTYTDALGLVKNESKSWLYKELEIHIEDFYNKNPLGELFLTASDVKRYWFANNNQVNISYIKKVLSQEMGLEPLKKQRYYPMGEISYDKTVVSRPFKIDNPDPSAADDIIPFGANSDNIKDPPF